MFLQSAWCSGEGRGGGGVGADKTAVPPQLTPRVRWGGSGREEPAAESCRKEAGLWEGILGPAFR